MIKNMDFITNIFSSRKALFFCFLCSLSATSHAFGDLMLSEQQRQELDALREGKHLITNTSTITEKKADKPVPKNVKVNGFYYRRDERHAPRLWVNGEQTRNKELTPAIKVRRIERDKQTVKLKAHSNESLPTSIKAGEVLDFEKRDTRDAYEK